VLLVAALVAVNAQSKVVVGIYTESL